MASSSCRAPVALAEFVQVGAIRPSTSPPITFLTASITSRSLSFSALSPPISVSRLAVAPLRSWFLNISIVRSSSAICVLVFSLSDRCASRSIALFLSFLSCSPKHEARRFLLTTGATHCKEVVWSLSLSDFLFTIFVPTMHRVYKILSDRRSGIVLRPKEYRRQRLAVRPGTAALPRPT